MDLCGCHYSGIDMNPRCEHRDPDGVHRPWLERDLALRVRERYTPEPVPPCRICGAPLGIASMGGNEVTLYACTNKAAVAGYEARRDHYAASYFRHRQPGDPLVLELVERYEALAKAVPA